MAPGAAGARCEKVMILSGGSRGDVQPYVALALEFRKAGYQVCLASHVDFEGFVSGEFGIKFYGVFCDVYKEITANPKLFGAMCKGNTLTFLNGVGDCHKQNRHTHMENVVRALDDFTPDMIVCGTLCEVIYNMVLYQERIPAIFVHLSGAFIIPPAEHPTVGFPNLRSCALHSWMHKQILWSNLYDFMLWYDDALKKLRGYEIQEVVSKRDFFQDLQQPPLPTLIAQNHLFFDLLYGPKHPMPVNTKYIGGMVVPPSAQLQRGVQEAEAGEERRNSFGGSSDMERLKGFLASGAPPVYMGWGSMICHSPEYMLVLVLKALKLSGLRAVILGGWAKLSLELLDQKKYPELHEYAVQNALFVHAAPHEWLFPQCAIVVHHGGTGTLQAGFRAAMPTIVTPCFTDQFDAAAVVNRLGVGLGLRQFQKLRPEELGEALKAVTTDAGMAKKARELSERLKADDGARKAVEEVEDFWEKFVKTGRLADFVEQRRSRPKPSLLARLAWCCK